MTGRAACLAKYMSSITRRPGPVIRRQPTATDDARRSVGKASEGADWLSGLIAIGGN